MKHGLWGFAVWLCGLLSGTAWWLLDASEEALDVAECKKALEISWQEQARIWELVEQQQLCSADACIDVFKEWEKGRQYPCEVQRQLRLECELAQDRRCSPTEGKYRDCMLQQSDLQDQLVAEREKLEECLQGHEDVHKILSEDK